MDIHKRIKQLRQEREWKQAILAEKLGVQQKQVSAYERGTSKPSTEVLIKLAQVFDVSLDYLVGDLHGYRSQINVKDTELLRYFEAVDKYEEEERSVAKEILNLLIIKHKFQELSKASAADLLK